MPSNMPIEIYKLMTSCCSQNPEDRPYIKGLTMWLQLYRSHHPLNKGNILSITGLAHFSDIYLVKPDAPCNKGQEDYVESVF